MKIHFIPGIIFLLFIINNSMYPYDISLDGRWKFTVDSSKVYDINNVVNKADWIDAVVPLSWQAQFETLHNYQGTAWYLRKIKLPKIPKNISVIIKFEAVDYLADVFVNKILVGSHEGGYTPLEFEIQKYIQPGENEIIVKVFDPVQGNKEVNGISYAEIPHGKQSWYIQNSGIWQSVYIQIKPKVYMKNIKISPSLNGDVDFSISVKNSTGNNKNNTLEIIVLDQSRNEIKRETKSISTINNKINESLRINNPKYWDMEYPNLYKARIILNNKDTLEEKFGFRNFEAKNRKFYLNDKPIYLIGALDQDFYPETIYTPPSEEYIKDEMIKAKSFGLNMLRCHIKVPDKRYLKAADEVGILIWYEVPNRDTFTVKGAKQNSQIIDEMLERDWNHPSIVILSIINESWGIDLQNIDQRKWLKNEYHRVKEKAKGRLVIDNSACYGNFHIATDINDYHTYWSVPDWYNKFSETIKEVNNRPKWLFSSFGDSEETGEEPLMISEFGNWGLPKLPEKLPWWFEKRFEDIEITLPSGVKARFTQYKYDEVFKSLDDLSEYSQQSQFTALKYEIEQIRLNPEIQGYIITEFTDLNWECNGLLDMWRNYKTYHNNLADIQHQDLIIPTTQKYSYEVNDAINIKLFLSHYSNKQLNNLNLFWDAGKYGSGKRKVEYVKDAGVSELNSVSFSFYNVSEVENLKINVALKDENGNIISQNFITIKVLPKIQKSPYKIYTYNLDNDLDYAITNSYSTGSLIEDSANIKQNEVVITNTLDEKVIALLKKGADILLLADSTTKLMGNFPFKIMDRQDGWYDGNWISNMNWIKNSNSLFTKLNTSKIMGFESSEILPGNVIINIPPEDFSDVLSGMFVGWLHLNTAYILQMKAGKGRLLLCTLEVNKVIYEDTYAKYYLNELIKYLTSDNFKPKLTWKLD